MGSRYKEPRSTYVDAFFLHALGSITEVADLKEVKQVGGGELCKFSKTLAERPEIHAAIHADILTAKNIRSELVGLRSWLEEQADMPKFAERIKKRIEEKEKEMKEFLTSLEEKAKDPNIQKEYTTYLAYLTKIEQIYVEEIVPLQTKVAELEAEDAVLGHLSVQHKEDATKIRGLDSMRKSVREDLQEVQIELHGLLHRTIIDDLGQEQEYVVNELYDAQRVTQLLDMRDSLKHGKFTVTPDLKHQIHVIQGVIRAGMPVMLAGPHGSGKTEALRYAAKEHMLASGQITREEYEDVPVYVFSGSKEASIYDLMGKLKIKYINVSITKRVEMFQKEMLEIDPEFDTSDKESIKMALVAFDAGQTFTQFSEGVLTRALKEGRPIIIDEIDQVPQEIIGRLNDILTKKPGDKVIVQENGEEEITVAKGFIVLATGNIKSDKYNRQELDAAFGSRFVVREHEYMTPADGFDLFLAEFLNEKDITLNPNIARESIVSIAKLLIAMKETQDVFQGRFKQKSFGTNAATFMELKKGVMTVRTLATIFTLWREKGLSSESLDEVIGMAALSPIDKQDQRFLLEILLRFGFFKDWTEEDFKKKLNVHVDTDTLNLIQGNITTEDFSDDPYEKQVEELEARTRQLVSRFTNAA